MVHISTIKVQISILKVHICFCTLRHRPTDRMGPLNLSENDQKCWSWLATFSEMLVGEKNLPRKPRPHSHFTSDVFWYCIIDMFCLNGKIMDCYCFISAFLTVAFITQVLLIYIPFIPLVEAKLNCKYMLKSFLSL